MFTHLFESLVPQLQPIHVHVCIHVLCAYNIVWLYMQQSGYVHDLEHQTPI